MKLRTRLAAIALCMTAAAMNLAWATATKAVSLVVMATNATAIPGEKVFTIGIQIRQADLTAPGTGVNPVLTMQDVTFAGSANGPIHQTGAANQPDIQSVQTNFINPAAVSGPPGALGSNGNNALYANSWWYNNEAPIGPGSGTLQGVIDQASDSGTVTTNPAGDGSGVYTVGAFPNSGTNAVGATGFTFQPTNSPGEVPANPTTGQSMSDSGVYGPLGENFLTQEPLKGEFVNGLLTVPLAQIVASGNIVIPSQFNGGLGTFIGIGANFYNVLGGAVTTDPRAFLDYSTNQIATPEPSSLVLAALGGTALVTAAARRRRHAKRLV